MDYLKVSIGIFLVLAVSRFIPHPPNFTSLIALSFYVPALFGYIYIPSIIISFAITDLIIGFHSTLLFTWGSVIIIGLIAKYFASSLIYRICGALSAAVIFFILSNFGVWSLGSYGYTFEGLVKCYVLAIPFFGYTIVSTIFFGFIIEIITYIFRNPLKNYLITK